MAARFLCLLIIALFLYVASPLFTPVAMGGVFAVLFFPAFEKLEKKLVSPRLASACFTLAVTLVFLLPASLLVFLGGKALWQQLQHWKDEPSSTQGSFFENVVELPGVHRIIEKISEWFPVGMSELADTAEDLARAIGMKVADFVGYFFSSLPGRTMGMVLMVISLFFFLVDGKRLVAFLRRVSVFTPSQTETLFHTFASLCRSVILASLVSGFAQAVLFLIGCLVLGVGNAPLIGFLVFLTSFIPLIGSAPITFGVALNALLSGFEASGIALLVIAVGVALLDNFVRPMVLKGSGNLHPLLAFIAAFGGLQVLGVSGIFIGPILAGLFVACVQILTESKPTARTS